MNGSTFCKYMLTMILCAVSLEASALSFSSQVASKGNPVSKTEAQSLSWPEGVLDLVNDPARTEGYEPFFSELPNDIREYLMVFKSTEDANRLLKKLSKIKATNLEC